MPLLKRQLTQLIRIVESMQQLITATSTSRPDSDGGGKVGTTRTRRRGKELVAFKKAISAERKAGVSVAELAEKHGVTPSYIYQL